MSDKPRMGQPPKPPGEGADSHLHIRVKRKDKARWVKEAQSRGMTLAALVHQKMG